MKIFLLSLFFLSCFIFIAQCDKHIDALDKLSKLKDLGHIDDSEFNTRREQIINSYLGYGDFKDKCKQQKFRHVQDTNTGPRDNGTHNSTWRMPIVFTPQVKWLVSIFQNSMPRSYDDKLPASGKLFWYTQKYLRERPVNPDKNNTVVDFDDEVAIQERALTHIGLNLYDGGVWAVALALSGLGDLVDVYYRNVLYTSATGSNDIADGVSNIRASSDLGRGFKYGPKEITDKALDPVRMPFNLTFVHKKDVKCCGCCEFGYEDKIPGNFFYRMIGPTYRLWDPFQGYYGYQWRAKPAGTNTDPTTPWNYAGMIHWNDWKPITGENVWAVMLAPMQTMFIKNCSHITKFSKFEDAPAEVQFSISIMPALMALQSTMGSMYHCPNGTEMFPSDESESTNVSNENNFSAWAAFKAVFFILDNFYTGSDTFLSGAKTNLQKLIEGLDGWFKASLMPAPIAGEKVVSQGGHITGSKYDYQKGDQAFAVDCQTWGLLNMGVKKFDGAYGSGMAYSIWKSTKKLAGYYQNKSNNIAGVGYTVRSNATNATRVWSGEWTWGAIFMCKRIGQEYIDAGRSDLGQDLLNDAKSMMDAMSKDAKVDDDGVWVEGGLVQCDGSYLYANARFFIPWGWYANPIGATSSTGWAIFNDYEYNPFQLGGGWNTTFYKTQCKDWAPDKDVMQKLAKYYDYKYDPKKLYHYNI